jgi:hypothetical protein
MCTFTAEVKETGATFSYDTETETYLSVTASGETVYTCKGVPGIFLMRIGRLASVGMTVLMIQAHRCSKRGPNEFPCQLEN